MILLLFLLLPSLCWGANLMWSYDQSGGGSIPATADVQKSPTPDFAAFTKVTIPSLPSTFALPAVPDNHYYRIQNTGGVSNVVQYTTPPPPYDDTEIKAEIAALKLRVTQLEATNAKLKAGWCALKGASLTKDVLAERAAMGGCP